MTSDASSVQTAFSIATHTEAHAQIPERITIDDSLSCGRVSRR